MVAKRHRPRVSKDGFWDAGCRPYTGNKNALVEVRQFSDRETGPSSPKFGSCRVAAWHP